MDIGACNAQGVIFDMEEEGNDEGELTTFWSRAAPRRLPIFIQNAPDEDIVLMAERYECRGLDGTIYGADDSVIGPRTTRDALTG